MAIMVYLVAFFSAAPLTVVGVIRTPDPDRARAYPREPERWQGMTGAPASLGCGARTWLFYAAGTGAFGAAGALCAIWMPACLPASLAVALLSGAIVAIASSRRFLRAGPGAMRTPRRSSKTAGTRAGERPRVLFICGSPNQTSQMRQIAAALPEVDAWFTPYFSDHWTLRLLVKLGLVESTILGLRRRGICLDDLNAHRLPVDLCAERNTYDLCVSCNDQVRPSILEDTPWVLVQEGIQEPPNWRTRLWRWSHVIPAPLTGTATFGLSDRYTRFCVASEGYRQRYLAEGIDPEKLVVTGMPNFDDFARHLRSEFPHRGYVLVCTSDARETWLAADRRELLSRAVQIAGRRRPPGGGVCPGERRRHGGPLRGPHHRVVVADVLRRGARKRGALAPLARRGAGAAARPVRSGGRRHRHGRARAPRARRPRKERR
jgi:hypothetical protein